MTEHSAQNGTTKMDPREVVARCEADLARLNREADELPQRRQELLQTETRQRMKAALASGDIAGAASGAMLDLEELDRREKELPFALTVAEARVYEAKAAELTAELERIEAQLPDAQRRFEELRDRLAEVEAEAEAAQRQYLGLSHLAGNIRQKRDDQADLAEATLDRGPNASPIGGKASPVEDAYVRTHGLRRRPQV